MRENISYKTPLNQAKTGEILVDGKRKWRDYKLKSLAIAKTFSFFEELKKHANQISECGSWLKFSSCPKGHQKKLLKASFCRQRMCVTCQWRKSLAMFHQVITLIHANKERYKSDIPLLLTLTVPNSKKDGLRKTIDNMQHSFSKLMQRRGVERAVRSWFRSLEVTYNEKNDDYHPHFHVLLMVPESYFKRDRGLYIDRDDWLKMWQESTGIGEITQVDIRRVRKRGRKGTLESITAEVAKYATKPSDYVKKRSDGEYEADSEVSMTLREVLFKRRLTAFGGLFAKLRKELKLKDVEQSDLVNITETPTECKCSVCQSTLVEELYRWHRGLRNYVG